MEKAAALDMERAGEKVADGTTTTSGRQAMTSRSTCFLSESINGSECGQGQTMEQKEMR